VLSNTDVLGTLKPGQHGSTFGGNPLACAVARASLKVLVEDGLIENSALLGEHFKARLQALRSNLIREVRGRGLMLAIEFEPEMGGARPIVERLRERGVLAKDTHVDTIRFAPPLIIAKDEVDWVADQVEAVVSGL
jgi:ornithine--oxo-acid transaminase